MRSRMQVVYGIWLYLWCAVLFLPLNAALGQQPQESATGEAQTRPAATTQPAIPQLKLSISELQLQLRQVQDAPDLANDVRSQVVGLYTQAIQQLENAEQWAARAVEYQTERQNAPQVLSAIQAELATPLGDPTPDLPADATRVDVEQRTRQAQSDLEAEKKALADWERERDRRTARRKEIPDLLTASKSRLQSFAEVPVSPRSGAVGGGAFSSTGSESGAPSRGRA